MTASYKAAHGRVKRERGLARERVCACGEPAVEWAYQHTDRDAVTSPEGQVYSPDPAHYKPMCRSCHRKLDWNEERQAQMRRNLHNPEAVEKQRLSQTGSGRTEEARANYRASWTPERRAAHGEKVRRANERKAR